MNIDGLNRLRSLDAAPETELTEAEQRRADAGLARILVSDAAAPAPRAPRRRARLLRWVALPVAAAAATAVAFAVVPGLQSPHAYASWTSDPSVLNGTDRSVADAACRDANLDLVRPDLVLAERRGDWVAVLYRDLAPAGTPEAEASCVVHLPSGSDNADVVSLARGGGGGVVPGPDEITRGGIFQSGGNGGLPWERPRPVMALTLGLVGDDVAAVTIRLADGTSVEATVADGTYAAWWPGEAFDPDTLGAPSGEGGPEVSFTYDVTLKDGSVLTDSEPSHGD